MTLTGTRKVSWHLTNTVSPQPVTQKTNFLIEDLNLFPVDGGGTNKNKTHKLNAGYHEWVFCFKLPSNLDQSVEGLSTNWVVYNLAAHVDRGYMSKQLSANTHIRVIRTLGRDVLEMQPMEQINEDIWANKLAYKITVPQKNFLVGSHVTVDFVLIPLRKGVVISTIKMELVESRQLFADFAGRRVSHQADVQVAAMEGDMPADSTRLVPTGVQDVDALFDESHRFSMRLDFPRSLKNCRQSVDTENIRLTHKLRLYVNLKNPEGHTSQLLVKNHVHLFISPNLPPNEDQSVVVDSNLLNQQAALDQINQNAPPTYGLHQLDELYNDIDLAGFATPSGNPSAMSSGTTTPFYAQSRSGSDEDITSLNAVAHHSGSGGASAIALQRRLQNLNTNTSASLSDNTQRFATASTPHSTHHSSGESTPAHAAHDPAYFDLPTAHMPISSSASASASMTPYDMAALTRTPSYNTAVRTPVYGSPVAVDTALPSYELATSRPSSPRGTRGNTPPSPTHSLDTLNEETYRNTQHNRRRVSPGSTETGHL